MTTRKIDMEYGRLLAEHRSKNLGWEDDVIEYRRAMTPSLIKKIDDRIQRDQSLPQYAGRNFYIVLCFRQELGGGFNPLVWTRISAPTPSTNQHVWKYNRAKGHKEFLWSLPATDLYNFILANLEKFMKDPETRTLARHVLAMSNGSLIDLVFRENKEGPYAEKKLIFGMS